MLQRWAPGHLSPARQLRSAAAQRQFGAGRPRSQGAGDNVAVNSAIAVEARRRVAQACARETASCDGRERRGCFSRIRCRSTGLRAIQLVAVPAETVRGTFSAGEDGACEKGEGSSPPRL